MTGSRKSRPVIGQQNSSGMGKPSVGDGLGGRGGALGTGVSLLETARRRVLDVVVVVGGDLITRRVRWGF